MGGISAKKFTPKNFAFTPKNFGARRKLGQIAKPKTVVAIIFYYVLRVFSSLYKHKIDGWMLRTGEKGGSLVNFSTSKKCTLKIRNEQVFLEINKKINGPIFEKKTLC